MKQPRRTKITKRRILPKVQADFWRAATVAVGSLQEWIERDMRPAVFCSVCRAEVPDRKELCAHCELSRRIRERIVPGVRTVGGMTYQPKYAREGCHECGGPMLTVDLDGTKICKNCRMRRTPCP